MAVKVIYKDIAPDAKEDIKSIETSEVNENLSNVELLRNDEVITTPYATLEKDLWRLDGTYKAYTNDNITYIGTQVSADEAIDGKYMFNTPIVITRTFNNKHTSVGVSIQFDSPDYCNYLNIKWYNDDVMVYSNDYYPDSVEYYCKQNVEVFNKIEITFYSMNKPNRLLKIWNIFDGLNRVFKDKDLISVGVLEEMSLISEDIPINTLDIQLVKQEDTDLIFQKKQPLLTYRDNEFIGMFFIDSGERTSKNIYEVSAVDYKGILENNTFYGGIYFDELAGNIINSIFADENIVLNIDDDTFNTKLSGYLKISTKREALMQVLFACCSVCNTSRVNTFDIFKLRNGLVEVPAERIKEGGKVVTESKITSVKISVHKYTKDKEAKDVFSGELIAGDNLIQFSNPIDITANVSVSGGTLKELHNNYCIVSVTEPAEVIVNAYEYVDNVTTKEMIDPDILLGKVTEVREITDATLVSNSNYEAVLQNVYNYYINNTHLESDMRIEDEQVGDRVTLHTDWSGDQTGRIEQLDYDIRKSKIGKVVQRINV